MNVFNKDDAEDGGLSFFILQKHRAQINYLDTRLSPSLRLSVSRARENTSDPVSGKFMKVFLRHKDLHAYGKICESVHKTASANKICKRKRSFAKV